MRISKANAEAIALKVTEPLLLKVKEAKKKLNEQALEYAEETVPEDIMKAFKKHPNYFETRSGGYMKGVGLSSREYIPFGKSLPSRSCDIELPPTKAKVIAKLFSDIEDTQKVYDDTKLRIESTIIGLGTYARIKENLPEIEKYLPVSTSTALALPIAQVRTDIKKLAAKN